MTDSSWTTVWMLKICAVFFVVATVVFLPFPEIDLWVSGLFYNGNNDFWLRQSELNAFIDQYIRAGLRIVAPTLIVLFFALLFILPKARLRSLTRYAFLLICLTLVTGFMVHAVFKENWGRARPKHVTEFAGEQLFTPALLPADQCSRNCSFVSGDASAFYALLALALYAAKRRKLWISVTVIGATGIGILRVMNGSHFLSDIIYSGIFTCGAVLLLYRWFEEKHWRDDLNIVQPLLMPVTTAIRTIVPIQITRWLSPVGSRFAALFTP